MASFGARLEALSAVTVCPCCIKGSLGDHVKRTARASGRPNYDLLLETLLKLGEREVAEAAEAQVIGAADGARDALSAQSYGQAQSHASFSLRRDAMMVSPRNGFVSICKPRSHASDLRLGTHTHS